MKPNLKTLDEIKNYLDNCIKLWRSIRDNKVPNKEHLQELAYIYIDAFQSLRVSIFGELLE